MFTGIITDVSEIIGQKKTIEGLKISIKKPPAWKNLKPGDSISVKGVCLTATYVSAGAFDVLLMPETLQKTTFGLTVPKMVNLERPLKIGGQLGGHFVQGHVDSVARVSQVSDKNGYYLSVEFPAKFKDLVIPKGSIAIDGVSLTIAELKNNELSVGLIPFTLNSTTLGSLKSGDKVNLEFDMIGKQVARITELRKK